MSFSIEKNVRHILKRVRAAELRSGREPGSVRVLAVSKTKPPEMVREMLAAGLSMFGENYLQDAQGKLALLDDIRSVTRWHFIGHLQRNKVKAAVRLFDCIETVDSLKLLSAIDRRAESAGSVQSLFVQVNIGSDPAKSGLMKEELKEFLEACCNFSRISVDGLMTIPPILSETHEIRGMFREMYNLFKEMQEVFNGRLPLCELSMGMSGDFEIAVEEGATIVRIGTLLFGPRNMIDK